MAKVKDLLVNGSSRFIGKIYASDQFISQVANGTAPFVVSSSTVVANLNADMTDGLHVHTGRNNEVNKIVRTDGSGYIQTGYINTNVGTDNLAISRIFYEYNNDGYIRKMSPSSFFSVLENSGNDISITVAGQNRKLTVGYARNSDKLDNIDSTGFYRFSHISNLQNKDLNYANNQYGTWNYGDDNTQKNTPTTTYGCYLSWGDLASSDTSTTRNQTAQIGINCWNDLGRMYVRARQAGNRDVTSIGSWRTVAFTTDIPTVTNYYWANIKVSASSSTSTQPTFNTCYTSNWFRSTGATGWYSESYGGGIRMTDSSWIRTFGSKNFYVEGGNFAVSGNAGIGTTSPSAKLHVVGVNGETLRLSMPDGNYTAGAGPSLSFVHGTNGEMLGWIRGIFNESSQGNRGNLQFATRTSDAAGPEVKMTILHNGNVGIGTTSPGYKLQIAGDSYTTGWSRADGGFYVEGTGVHFTHHGKCGEIDMASNNEFLWGSSSATLYFNYRAVSRGTTVNNYIWNAGSSSSYASHTLGSLTSMGNQTLYGLTSTCNSGNSASYTEAAVQIREYNFGGAQSDTWGNAPRLAWHWSGRVQAQIGLGGNNHLYISEDGSFSTPRLILHSGNSYVTGGKGVIAGTTITQVSNADYASSAGSVAWGNVTGKPINLKAYSGSLSSAGWKTLQGNNSSPSIAISYNNSAANWNSGTYSASMVWGCSDTRGLIDCAYNTPKVTFGGCSFGGATDNNPTWYFKLAGTTGTEYNLDTRWSLAGHNHDGKYLRKDTNDSTSYQYEFTKTNDHAIKIGTIRGRAVGSQTGEYIHLYERVAIGSPSGWGSRNAPTYGLATYGGAWLATDTGNVTIGGTNQLSSAWGSFNLTVGNNTNKVVIGYLNSSTNGVVVGGHNNALSAWAPLNIAGTTLYFRINETIKATIDSNGNFGIGTSSPGYKLHVAGDVYANGGWLRSSGNTGWYNESYGGGWYMTDSSWVRTYNGKGVVAGGFYHSSYGSSDYVLTSEGGAISKYNFPYYPWKEQWIDMTGYSESYWHPVVTSLPYSGYKRIKVTVQLNSGTKPSWSTHSNGFTCNLDLLTTAYGWGTTRGETICLNSTYYFADQNPVGWSQLGNSSHGILLLRGGGKYLVCTDWDSSWTIYNQSVTDYGGTQHEQTCGPYTSWPGIFNGATTKNTIHAHLNGNATTATKLANSRTIWGQSFDGTGNVDGHIISTLTDWRIYYNTNKLFLQAAPTGIFLGEGTADTTYLSLYGKYIRLYIGSSEKMRISESGNVGIGTTSPSYKLHVVGDIYTTTGFKKNGSSDSYVLLGGGGHKLESSLSVNYANSAGSADSVSWGNVTGKSIGLVIVNKNNGTSSVYSSINYAGCLTASASGTGGTRRITVTNNSSKLVKIACSVSSVYPANSYEFGWAHFTSSPPDSISANSSAIFNISFGYIHCHGSWAAKDYVQRGSGGYTFSCIAFYED